MKSCLTDTLLRSHKCIHQQFSSAYCCDRSSSSGLQYYSPIEYSVCPDNHSRTCDLHVQLLFMSVKESDNIWKRSPFAQAAISNLVFHGPEIRIASRTIDVPRVWWVSWQFTHLPLITIENNANLGYLPVSGGDFPALVGLSNDANLSAISPSMCPFNVLRFDIKEVVYGVLRIQLS